MNFELKPLGLAAVASEKCDALVVLIPEGLVEFIPQMNVLISEINK